MIYWLKYWLDQIAKIFDLSALTVLLILIPLGVYLSVKGALLSRFAPFMLRFIVGGSTVFQRYSGALNAFVERLTPFFYDGPHVRKPIHIYSTFLAIALGYTVTIFFLGWSLTGDASIGIVRLIKPDYPTVIRAAIAVGWVLLGFLVIYSVTTWPTGQQGLAEVARRLRIPLSLPFMLSFAAACLVFLSQYVSRLPHPNALAPRTFGFSPSTILYVQIALAVLTFVAMYRSDRYFSGFAYVATACYGLALGVPILIGIPLGVAIATYYVGRTPILASTALVPAVMLAFGFLVNSTFQVSEYGALALAAIACSPIALTMYLMNPTGVSRSVRLGYAGATFLPVWIPVSFSENQISHPVAFAVVIFWFLVPLLNAIWDSLSWWATWGLLDSLRKSLAKLVDEPTGNFIALQRVWQVIKGIGLLSIHVVANLLVSTALFFAMFFMVIVGLRIIGRITPPSFKDYFIDVPSLLAQIQQNPFGGDGFWLVMLVFITLFPALFHLLAIVFGVVAIALAPRKVQEAFEVVSSGKTRDGKTADFREAIMPAVNRIALYFAAGGVLIEIMAILLLLLYRFRWDGVAFGDILFSIGHSALAASQQLGL